MFNKYDKNINIRNANKQNQMYLHKLNVNLNIAHNALKL